MIRAAVLVAALVVVACGSSSSPSSSGGGQMGAACTCSGATDAGGGDFLCSGSGQTTCASSLYCIDGTCSTFCQLDGGTCPAGFVCKQTPHSNLTVYCAPQ